MTDFENSYWSDSGVTQEYREQADGYVPERRKLIEITQPSYQYFIQLKGVA
jgi:hypothetical protein